MRWRKVTDPLSRAFLVRTELFSSMNGDDDNNKRTNSNNDNDDDDGDTVYVFKIWLLLFEKW